MMTIVQLLNGYQSHFGTNPCKFQIRLFQRSLETAWYGWFEKTCWFRSILINFGEYSMREWTNLNKIVKAIGTNWCKFKRHDQNIPKCSCHLAVSQTLQKSTATTCLSYHIPVYLDDIPLYPHQMVLYWLNPRPFWVYIALWCNPLVYCFNPPFELAES